MHDGTININCLDGVTYEVNKNKMTLLLKVGWKLKHNKKTRSLYLL